jgi:hypothetical protein
MKVVGFTLFLFLNISWASALEDEGLGLVIDTCNCPRIEEFSSDIQDVLTRTYSNSHPTQVPIEFDQLTLLMDLNTRLELDMRCGEVFGNLSEYERELSESLSGDSISESIRNTLSYSSNINLGEFNPNLMRIATDNDRTLFFRGNIAGEEKYIVMRIGRDGESVIEVLDSPPTPFTSAEASSTEGFETPFNSGIALTFSPSDTPVPAEPVVLNSKRELSFPERINETTVSGQLNGVRFDRRIETDEGNLLEFGAGISVSGSNLPRPMTRDEELERTQEERLKFPSTLIQDGDSDVRSVAFSANAAYTHSLGEDRELEFRLDSTSLFGSDTELLRRQTEVGASYGSGDYSFDVDIRDSTTQEFPEAELRFGNLGARMSEAGQIQSGLRINTPALSFSGIPTIQNPANTRRPFVAPTNEDGEPDDRGGIISVGLTTDLGQGPREADLAYYNRDGERMTALTGRYAFDTGDYNITGATGTDERRVSFQYSDSVYNGRDLALQAYTRRGLEIENGVDTAETIISARLAEIERTPSELGFDHIRTKNSTSEDGLVAESIILQTGAIIRDDDTVTLKFSRTASSEYSMDSGNAIVPVGSESRHLAAEATLGEEHGEARLLAMRSRTVLGFTQGTAADVHAVWNEEGESIEAGFTLFRGTEYRSSSCRIGARLQNGGVRSNATLPNFRGSTRESFDCNVVMVDDDTYGLGVELVANYVFQERNGTRYYVSVVGDFQDGSWGGDTGIRLGGEIILNNRQPGAAGTPEERDAAREWFEGYQDTNLTNNPLGQSF